MGEIEKVGNNIERLRIQKTIDNIRTTIYSLKADDPQVKELRHKITMLEEELSKKQ